MADCLVPNKNQELIHELGICGCGCPNEAYCAIRELLVRINARDKTIIGETDENPYLLYTIYILNEKGFLDHGSSVYGSFLSDKGKELLAALEIFGDKYEYDMENVIDSCDDDMWNLKTGD